MKKQTISVVLAVFNEEKYLKDCLSSVKNLADEIVIVDGSSTDKTVDIAKEFGANVIVTTNPPMFHINKQKAIDSATKDWILQLDADERVTPALADEIKQVIGKTSPQPSSWIKFRTGSKEEREINGNEITGYWIPRKNWYLGRYLMKGGVYPDYTLRLYKNGKGHLPMKDVHEQAVVEGNVGYLKNPLEHLADPSFRRYLLRFGRYTDLMALEFKEKKQSKNIVSVMKYMAVLPFWSFAMVYGRHKGFQDSWQGLVWAFFSAMRFPVSYIKYMQQK